MIAWLSVDTTFFTILGYPMSYVEFGGTILCLWSVWLVARRNVLTWPAGIASAVLYLALFYQIRLYADALEQLYYVISSVYGWWFWLRASRGEQDRAPVGFSPRRTILLTMALTALLSLALGIVVSRLNQWWPGLFPQPASYPLLDAATTMMSFTAQVLMARKRTECWVYWIIVDVIAIGLYYVKSVHFIALLYVILLCLATQGWLTWRKAGATQPGSIGLPSPS